MSAQFIRVNLCAARASSDHSDKKVKAYAQAKEQYKACDLAWYKCCEWATDIAIMNFWRNINIWGNINKLVRVK